MSRITQPFFKHFKILHYEFIAGRKRFGWWNRKGQLGQDITTNIWHVERPWAKQSYMAPFSDWLSNFIPFFKEDNLENKQTIMWSETWQEFIISRLVPRILVGRQQQRIPNQWVLRQSQQSTLLIDLRCLVKHKNRKKKNSNFVLLLVEEAGGMI